MKNLPAALLFLSFSAVKLVGQPIFGSSQFVEYDPGRLPIIISAPHGGSLEPDSLPNRICLGATTVKDTRTLELAQQIDTSLFALTGCHAHIVVCHLHRKKLDCNRDLPEAACGNPTAEQAWTEYQAFLDSAKNCIKTAFSRGIFIDLHGHGHAVQQLELGYLLAASELQQPDSVLNQPSFVEQSSIRHLAETNLPDSSHAQLLHGQKAFGSLLRKRGYPSVPSDEKPFPLPGEPYFNGGYNTARHGSSNGGTIDAVQIETNFTGVRDSPANRKKFADSLALVLRDYLWSFDFGLNFPFCLDLSGDGLPCENGSYEYSTDPFPGCVFEWTVDGGLILSGQGTAKIQVKWLASGPGQVIVRRNCP